MKIQLQMHAILAFRIGGKTIHIGGNLILSLPRWRHARRSTNKMHENRESSLPIGGRTNHVRGTLKHA